MLRCLLVPKKDNLTDFSTGLTGWSKNLGPTGNPTSAGLPDRFPSLVYTIQNGAYARNSLTAYSVGGHNIMLNWMTEITDLLQLFVAAVKFGSDYASREVVLSF